MSEQSKALNKLAIDSGVLVQQSHVTPELDESDPQRPGLPWVQLPVDGRINNDFNRDVGAILSPQTSADMFARFAGKGLFRYKGRIVTVGVHEITGRIEIEEMTAHRFRSWVEEHMICYRHMFSKHGATKVKQTMGVDMSQTCLESDEFRRRQPRLLRVNTVRLPIKRKDGRIELLPAGYDGESCILTIAPTWEYDEAMTMEAAKCILDDLDREFPFQDPRSKAVFRAAMMGQFGYFLQPLDAKRLNFLFHANSSRSGKTLLVEIILTLAWSYASVDAMPDDTGKLRDRLDTAVREAKPYLVFDDLEQNFLRSGMLNAFMTATWWSGRKFHSQEEFQEPKTPVVFLTANNLEVTTDIAGRTLTCDLFTPEADAQEREIERPIDVEWIRTPTVHRQICSAMWTLIKLWRDGGRPHEGKIVAGYHEWSRIFGGIAISAGFGDPCLPRESDGYGASEYGDMRELVSRLSEGVEKAVEYEFIDVVLACRELNCFAYLIKGRLTKVKDADGDREEFVPSDETNSSLGKLLGRYGGKSFVTKTGKRVVFDKRGKNRHRRYVLQVVAVVGAGSK